MDLDLANVLAWIVGVGRLLTGLWFLVGPTRPAQTWVESDATEIRYLVRAVGGRDLVIGAGIIWALVAADPVLAWLFASVASDATDASMGALMLSGKPRQKALIYALSFGALGVAAAAFVVAA